LRRALDREIPGAPQIGYGPVPFPIEAMEPLQYAGHAAAQHAA
jgi:hypothetical protein